MAREGMEIRRRTRPSPFSMVFSLTGSTLDAAPLDRRRRRHGEERRREPDNRLPSPMIGRDGKRGPIDSPKSCRAVLHSVPASAIDIYYSSEAPADTQEYRSRAAEIAKRFTYVYILRTRVSSSSSSSCRSPRRIATHRSIDLQVSLPTR